LAAAHDAPLYCMSILGALPQAHQFRRRLPEVGSLQFGSVIGGARHMGGHIHAILLALTAFGGGVRRVYSTGTEPLDVIQLEYDGAAGRPAAGVTISCHVGEMWHCAYYATATGPGGGIFSGAMGDFVFPSGAAAILRQLPELVREGKQPADFGLMVEGVAIAEAARAAHRTGGGVSLDRDRIDAMAGA